VARACWKEEPARLEDWRVLIGASSTVAFGAKRTAIDAFEERYVLHLLERTQHNVSKVARLAGIDRNYLYRMMKKHGIARKE
jgi:transcriptional regulator of acetoin/glycerol metabolism